MKARVAYIAAVLSIGLVNVAAAAQVYVVHGIPAQDVGAPLAVVVHAIPVP